MATTHALPGARFVDPQVLARIGNLDLLARNVVNGFINGLHRAPYFGASIDFAEHRGYVPGDDIPASAKHFDQVLNTLEHSSARRPGHLTVVAQLAEHFKRRGILALISDFYEEPDAVLEAVKPLRFLGNDLVVFHVLDPAELDFTYADPSAFEDLESGEQIPVVPESLGDQYRTLIREHTAALATKFSEHRIDYTVLNTALPLDHALFSYLSSREKLMHVR